MNLGDMGRMMKQVQKLQADMAAAQERLAEMRVEGSAGGGVVRAVCTGQQDVVSVTIDPSAVDPSDVEMLQDLVTAALNDAIRRSREVAAKELSILTGGLSIPGLPF